MFADRTDAGKQLAKELEKYKNQDALILAIPRGGVPVGFEIAKYLDAEFSMIIARKLPFPYNPESGFGAVAEDGSTIILRAAAANLSKEMITSIIEDQKQEIKRRIKILRGGQPLPNMEDRTVILVDDGIAMGSTMRASIKTCKNMHSGRLIIAAPVGSPEVARAIKFKEVVDETVILEKPKFFRAVAQVYEKWHDVADHEVLAIMNEWQKQYSDLQ